MSNLGQLYLKKHLKEEQAQLEEAAQEAQDSQKKKGLFSLFCVAQKSATVEACSLLNPSVT